ncbi:hypothetical protein BSL78_00125 [Apostichopus japonicus]|uniref:Tubulin epsilon and delta complex protein 1 domain-containing protein n=1 Tax=Stichopus japonicus TaxID=307972 RepID=A0A2G8LRU0_STIJA|nr:hypothetical protein BSL78_00125 [Apostichopus japonicus]
MASQPVKVSSSKMRLAIGTLCQFLSLSGFSPISPETLRQAKFNKREAVGPLLSLLAELIDFSTATQCAKSPQFNREETVYVVHSGMLSRHFQRRQFYLCLDIDNSTCHSSRELLIAIGWLICTESLLKQMLFSKETSSLRSFPDVSHKLQERKIYMINTREDMEAPSSFEQYLNGLVWNMGKCRLATKQWYWKEQEIVKLAHKIHVATQGVSLAKNRVCLSPADVTILRYKDKLEKHLHTVEKENRRLQMFFQWLEKEEIFWQWMESVIDAENSERIQNEDPAARSQVDDSYPFDDYSKTLADLSSQLDTTLKEVTQRMQFYDKSLMEKSVPSGETGNPLDVRFEFVPKRVKDHIPKSIVHSQSDWSPVGGIKDIEEEILILSKRLSSLEAKLLEQRDAFSCSCTEMLASIDGVVSIPPILCNQR